MPTVQVDKPDPLYGVPEAADYLSRNVSFVRRMIATQQIEYIKVGAHVRIRQSVLDAYLAERTVPVIEVRPRTKRKRRTKAAA